MPCWVNLGLPSPITLSLPIARVVVFFLSPSLPVLLCARWIWVRSWGSARAGPAGSPLSVLLPPESLWHEAQPQSCYSHLAFPRTCEFPCG